MEVRRLSPVCVRDASCARRHDIVTEMAYLSCFLARGLGRYMRARINGR